MRPNVSAHKFKLTPPPQFVPLEYSEQVAVFDYLRWCKLDGADMFYATLNGVRLPIGLAVKMSRAGLLQGPPDINGDVGRGSWLGFRGELKRIKGGVVSDEQKLWHKRLQDEGYYVCVARGAKAMIEEIERYLKLPKTCVVHHLMDVEDLKKLR
jgi:hypothetical protein